MRFANYIVFDLLLGLEILEFQEVEAFEAVETPKINYSQLNIGNSFHISPVNLLFQSEIFEGRPPHHLEAIPLLFPIQNCDIHFDPLAAAFFVVSRYEEYQTYESDAHDRFPAQASILHQLDGLKIPIVQTWTKLLAKKLKTKYPDLMLSKRAFHFTPSFDIDMAWSYKGKGISRTIGGWVKDLLALDISAQKERIGVQMGARRDPFDKFEYFQTQMDRYKLLPIFFFLMGNYSDYDKNIRPDHPKFVQLIKNISAKYKVGIHPSYYHETNISREIAYLENALQSSISISRQHFVKLKFPETYTLLIKHGIEEDFSMGYPDAIGFRNGLAIPSRWYDLNNEKITQFVVHPFQIMDVTLKNYLKLNPMEAIEAIKKIIDVTEEYGGHLVTIWHNSSFDKNWQGWDEVFEEMLSYAAGKQSIENAKN